MSEAHDRTVSVTAGLSAYRMPVPSDQNQTSRIPDRIELIAFSSVPIVGGQSGSEDVLSAVLQMIGDYIINQKLAVGVGHTLDFGEPLASNVAMTAILFSLPQGVDSKRIERCSEAMQLLNIVPITAKELEYCRQSGVIALLDRFDEVQIPPVFDCFRGSAV